MCADNAEMMDDRVYDQEKASLLASAYSSIPLSTTSTGRVFHDDQNQFPDTSSARIPDAGSKITTYTGFCLPPLRQQLNSSYSHFQNIPSANNIRPRVLSLPQSIMPNLRPEPSRRSSAADRPTTQVTTEWEWAGSRHQADALWSLRAERESRRVMEQQDQDWQASNREKLPDVNSSQQQERREHQRPLGYRHHREQEHTRASSFLPGWNTTYLQSTPLVDSGRRLILPEQPAWSENFGPPEQSSVSCQQHDQHQRQDYREIDLHRTRPPLQQQDSRDSPQRPAILSGSWRGLDPHPKCPRLTLPPPLCRVRNLEVSSGSTSSSLDSPRSPALVLPSPMVALQTQSPSLLSPSQSWPFSSQLSSSVPSLSPSSGPDSIYQVSTHRQPLLSQRYMTIYETRQPKIYKKVSFDLVNAGVSDEHFSSKPMLTK